MKSWISSACPEAPEYHPSAEGAQPAGAGCGESAISPPDEAAADEGYERQGQRPQGRTRQGQEILREKVAHAPPSQGPPAHDGAET